MLVICTYLLSFMERLELNSATELDNFTLLMIEFSKDMKSRPENPLLEELFWRLKLWNSEC